MTEVSVSFLTVKEVEVVSRSLTRSRLFAGLVTVDSLLVSCRQFAAGYGAEFHFYLWFRVCLFVCSVSWDNINGGRLV